MAELALNQFHRLAVSDIAGGGYDEVIRREPILKAGAKSFAIEAADRFRGTQNGPAEGMFGPKAPSENLMEEIFRIVQVHLDFFKDNLALFPDVVGVKLRAENKIGDDVEGDGQVLVQNFGVEANLLFGGEGVQHAPDRIHLACNVLGRAALRAFENHMLHKVGEAIFLGNLAAGAIADPDADGNGADMRHGLRDDHEAIGQRVAFNVPKIGSKGRHVYIVA